ncbi:MAG TPA: EAL domain-containing protein [Pseudonocardiaceae bacterium]|nr:EAL domain-containing protein [Pseudonocardiaceae bacterium]
MAERVKPTGHPRTGSGSGTTSAVARSAYAKNASSVADLPEAPSLLCDKSGRVVRANPAAAELIGVPDPDDLVGRSIDDLLTGDESQRWLRRADGGAVLVRAVRWRVPGTGLDAVLLTDLTDLATSTEALRVERRRLNEAQALARMGWWEYDRATKHAVWSRSLHALLGVRPGTVEPNLSTMMSFIHPEDVAQARAAWLRHSHQGEPIDIECRIIRADGELRWVRAVASAPTSSAPDNPVTGYATDVTDRRLAREALEVDREALLDAQRIARIGSLVYDLKTGEVQRSKVLDEMYAELGLTPQEKSLFHGLAPAQLPEVKKLCERFAGDDPPRHPLQIELTSEAGNRTFVVRARAKTNERGRAITVQCTLQDVTQQRLLERQLLEDRRRFDDAQRAARLGTWEWDPRTDSSIWSPMLYELFGVQPGTPVTHQSFLGMVHAQDRGWVEELFTKLVKDAHPVDCEYRLVRTDGSVRIFRCYGAMSPGATTEEPILIGTSQDVTEQRAAETRMLRSSQRFADLVALNPVGIGIFDESERLVDANDALCDLLGAGLEKLRGRTAEALTHPDDRDGYPLGRPPSANQAKRTHKVPQRVLVRADGEPVYCELHVAMSVQDDGRRFWLVVFQDITERRRAAETLRHQATHDELTGLPNRAAVNELLIGLLEHDAAKVAVLFCDIDNFKRVNDSLGHDAGDELLVALARRLEGGLPEGSTVARLSGDEYVIICADIDAAGGVDALATRVSALLRTAVPVHGQLVRVSASIGAAVPDGSPVSGADLLRFADAAMFEAKKQGPGRVATASAALIASADRQVHLEGQLRDALATDGLALHFQPVVGADGTVQTAEALVRWPHPERGMLSPDVFLPVAEQGGLMRELDRWVLRTALAEAATWPTPGGKPVAVAVNLSGLAPGDPEFVDIVANAVLAAGIEWDRVVLELVETSLVDLPSRTLTAMADLVSRGVRFAVDDFGTGYSSLSRLKDLPVQIIKVDRTFVAGVGSDSSDFAVASAVVDMSRAMGRSCVAEGVENATQFHVLRGMGVDAYQGWLFSRAIPIKAFRELLGGGPLHVPNPG